ncbi:Double-stranded beta helix domain-containing protein [Neorhizobium galegae bv. orientalis]|uniref:Double-stranded beta helix domain-containing protein n=2 Tax=Neorhizobium galegae TaxID=399 RepID=A0A068SLV7_NEOGA|nr:Double-stranded beta helix domain-containing protein [Neorhizobium galegae bv. orientalis str. HAMBI 540]CDZ44423.1 Double-stranded beta helix domain-containing protein [Neorhizobium galegae bv. orientalis]
MNRSIKITPPSLDAMTSAADTTLETILFEPGDWVPNNPELPVLVYRQAVAAEGEMAPKFESRFRENGWKGIWRNGVFDYQHYHTGAHEVLGIAGGRARLLIGGPDGTELSVHAGDCLILPAGTGHMRIDASRDFLVVGAYPPRQEADIQTRPASEAQLARIANLPLPKTDPVGGATGALLRAWPPRRS